MNPLFGGVSIGDIVYSKKVSKRGGGVWVEYKTHRGMNFISVCLGAFPEKKDPEGRELKDRLAGLGWVMFDDVLECLGKKATDKLAKHVDKKYAPKVQPSDKLAKHVDKKYAPKVQPSDNET